MKAKNWMTAIAVVMVAFSLSAAAQMDPAMKVNIPFSFRAGETLMAPGSYTVSQIVRLGNVLRLEEKNDAIMMPVKNLTLRDNSDVKLVFRRYGDNYFLAQVWLADRLCELPQTKLESEYAARFPVGTTIALAEK